MKIYLRLYNFRNYLKVENTAIFNNTIFICIYGLVLYMFFKMGLLSAKELYSTKDFVHAISSMFDLLYYNIEQVFNFWSGFKYDDMYFYDFTIIIKTMLIYSMYVFYLMNSRIFHYDFDLGIIYNGKHIQFKSYYIFTSEKDKEWTTNQYEYFFQNYHSKKKYFKVVEEHIVDSLVKRKSRHTARLDGGKYYEVYVSDLIDEGKRITQSVWKEDFITKRVAKNYYITNVDLDYEFSLLPKLKLFYNGNKQYKKSASNETNNVIQENNNIKLGDEVQLKSLHVKMLDLDPEYLYESYGRLNLLKRIVSIIIITIIYSIIALLTTFVFSYVVLYLNLDIMLFYIGIMQYLLFINIMKNFNYITNKINKFLKVERVYINKYIHILLLIIPFLSYYMGKILAVNIYEDESIVYVIENFFILLVDYANSGIVFIDSHLDDIITKFFMLALLYKMRGKNIFGTLDFENGIYIDKEFIEFKKMYLSVENKIAITGANDQYTESNFIKYFNKLKPSLRQVYRTTLSPYRIYVVYYGYSNQMNRIIVQSNLIKYSFRQTKPSNKKINSILRKNLKQSFLVFDNNFAKELNEIPFSMDCKWTFK